MGAPEFLSRNLLSSILEEQIIKIEHGITNEIEPDEFRKLQENDNYWGKLLLIMKGEKSWTDFKGTYLKLEPVQ